MRGGRFARFDFIRFYLSFVNKTPLNKVVLEILLFLSDSVAKAASGQ